MAAPNGCGLTNKRLGHKWSFEDEEQFFINDEKQVASGGGAPGQRSTSRLKMIIRLLAAGGWRTRRTQLLEDNERPVAGTSVHGHPLLDNKKDSLEDKKCLCSLWRRESNQPLESLCKSWYPCSACRWT